MILRLICLALLQKKKRVRHKDEDEVEEEKDWVKQIIRKKKFCFILIEKKIFQIKNFSLNVKQNLKRRE